MQYDKIYNAIVVRAVGRKKLKRDNEEYVYYEKHHIIPRCLSGSDTKDNLVLLTAEEHWVAHLLLVKMYPGNNKLVFACQAMSMAGGHNKRTTNKLFGWIRRAYCEASSLQKKGQVVPQERRDKISATLKGRPAPHLRGTNNAMQNPVTKEKALAARKGKKLGPRSEETKRKISEGNKGHKGPTGELNAANRRVCCYICRRETALPNLTRDHKKCIIG